MQAGQVIKTLNDHLDLSSSADAEVIPGKQVVTHAAPLKHDCALLSCFLQEISMPEMSPSDTLTATCCVSAVIDCLASNTPTYHHLQTSGKGDNLLKPGLCSQWRWWGGSAAAWQT